METKSVIENLPRERQLEALDRALAGEVVETRQRLTNRDRCVGVEDWAGRSFVSAGPLVYFTLDGKDPGDEIHLEAGTHTMRAVAEVKSITPIAIIELLFNGEVVATLEPEGEPLEAVLDEEISVSKSGWFGVRARAKFARHPIRRPYPFAATNPIRVLVDYKLGG